MDAGRRRMLNCRNLSGMDGHRQAGGRRQSRQLLSHSHHPTPDLLLGRWVAWLCFNERAVRLICMLGAIFWSLGNVLKITCLSSSGRDGILEDLILPASADQHFQDVFQAKMLFNPLNYLHEETLWRDHPRLAFEWE